MIEVYKTIGGGARMGVELTQDEKQQTVGLSAALVLKPDPMRLAVMFQVPSAGNVTLSINPAPSAGVGLLIASKARPIIISDDQMPGLAARQWYAIADTAVTILEVMYVRLT